MILKNRIKNPRLVNTNATVNAAKINKLSYFKRLLILACILILLNNIFSFSPNIKAHYRLSLGSNMNFQATLEMK
ncbi:hypothetical protein NBRC116600_15270 [Thalassotalea sp. SU-HH00458]